MLATCGLGTWRWFTLSYVLAPTALEIRYGTSRVRIRFEDMEAITRAEPSETRAPSLLWPGAPAGDERLGSGRVARWWGTTHRRAHCVMLYYSGRAVVLTPAKPEAFCEALWSNARGAVRGLASREPRPRGWLDQVASLDGWFRFLTLLAFGVAAAVIPFEIAATGSISRPSMVATSCLLINAGFGLLTLPRAPRVARVLMSATLALQCLGLLL
jgi:hypothetical protein